MPAGYHRVFVVELSGHDGWINISTAGE